MYPIGRSLPRTEIEQWAVLRTVVEAGSFAKAALQLHRSQSSVSYATARLQERLGIALLRVEGRRAVLTTAGRLLLAEAMSLIEDFGRLEQRAWMMAGGEEPRIRLLVDSICPKKALFDALAVFQADHPVVEIELSEIIRLSIDNVGIDRFDLAITARNGASGSGYPVAPVEMIAVSSPGHPLQGRGGQLSNSILSRHAALTIEGGHEVLTGPNIEQGRHWRVNSLDAAVEAVRRGLCHGWLPKHLIEEDLERGDLVALPLGNGGARLIPIMLSYADEEMAGPLTRRLAAVLQEKLVSCA
jgi:DNA-binding transcriptional LysR family regulator